MNLPDYLNQLSTFIARTDFEALPEATVARARWVFADTIAVIGAGMQEPEMKSIAAAIATPSGTVPIIGGARTTDVATAALVNGTAGTMLELDEGNQFARGHPAIHVVPAALAVGQALGRSGREVLTAMVLGYEVGARIGIASKLKMTMHPHGTWGTVGAAVTVAKLHRYDAAGIARVINIASSLGLSTSRKTMLEGGTVRNAFSGLSNQLGVFAEQLARAGFTGERDGLSTVYGTVIAEDWRPEEMIASLGERWEIARNYFKRHACCRYNHATLDALGSILERRSDLEPSAIQRVDIETYSLAAQLCDQRPDNMLAAKFSVPFAVATFLHHRAATIDAFRAPALHDPAIRELATRVVVREDPALTAMVPAKRPSRVHVRLRDGSVETAEAFINKGDTEDPYTEADLTEKFFELGDAVWGRAAATRLFEAVMRIDAAASLQDIASVL